MSPEEKVRSFLKGLPEINRGNGHAYGMVIGDRTCTVRAGPCHSMFNSVPNPKSLGSGFRPKQEQMPLAERFWQWVTDPDKSPWKKLMLNGIEQVLAGNSLPNGFILPEKTLKETPFNFQKNFCILMRVFTEKYDCFEIWNTLLDKGLPETEAFYLCSTLMSGNPAGYTTATSQHLSGGHWPLTDGATYYSTTKWLDFDKFRSGDIKLEERSGTEKINGFFQLTSKNKRLSRFNPGSWAKPIITQGSFSRSTYFELDDIIDGFYKWQDKEGITCVTKS